MPIALALGDAAADLVFSPVAPCRIIDTRLAGGTILSNAQRSFVVSGVTDFEAQGGNPGGCAIPEGAAAVVVNFVAVNPAGPGVSAPGPPVARPVPGLNIANGVIVPLCAPGPCAFDLTVQADVSATDLVADVLGYYQGVATGSVSGSLLADGAVTGTKLADGAVTGAKLGPNAVDGSKILDGSIGAVDVNLGELQRRVTGVCALGEAIRVVNGDGTVLCETDDAGTGTVTGVTAGTGLTGGTITTTGTLAVDFGGRARRRLWPGAITRMR
jgi:hypothetical protein